MEYEQAKREVIDRSRSDDPAGEPSQAQRLRELVEHNREHPSPVRIVRRGE